MVPFAPLPFSFVIRRFCILLLAMLTVGASFPSHALIEFFTAPEFRWKNANGPNVPGGYGSPGAAFDAFKAVNDVPCLIKHVNLHHGASVNSNPPGPGVFWNAEYSNWIWDIEHYDPLTCQLTSTAVDGGGWINFETVCPVEMGGAAGTKLLSPGRYEAFCRGVRLDDCNDNDCRAQNAIKGNPVNALTGNKSQTETDYAGAGGMTFKRRYTSQDGGFHSQLSSRLGGSTIPVNAAQACYESVVTIGGTTLPYCGRFLDTSSFQIAFVNSQGRYVIFKGSESAPTTTANIDDKLTALTNGSGQREWRVERDDNTIELFNASGRMISRSFHDGRVHTFTYSDATTPASVAPGPGYLLTQQDDHGRTLSWTYNSAGQVATMRDPANQVITYTYFDPATCTPLTCKKLQSVTFQDNTQRTYHWNEGGAVGDQATNRRLSGITDELGNRFSTYVYNTGGKVISSEHAGGVYKYTFSYAPLNVTDPLGTVSSFSYQNYNDVYLPTSIVRPSATGSGNSTETSSYDPQGRRYSHVAHGGSRTCYGYDKPRNLEVVRFEGANAGANCTENLHQTPLSGTGFDSYKRRISTEWHADWRLPKRIAEPLKITTLTYNGEGGVYCESTQAQVNGKPLALVCSKSVQSTTDATGGSAFGATSDGSAARVWTYTYNALGQVLTVNGPRTDVSDVTTYAYYANNSGQGLNRGMLNTVTNAAGHVTTFSNYDAHGNALTITDANSIVTTLTYDLRQRLKTRTTAGELTTYDYDDAGQLKKVTSPSGSFIEFFYDNAHRLYRIQDGLGNKVDFVLDNMGNRKEEQTYDPTNVLSRLMKREFSALNWLFKDVGGTSPANQVTEYGYDNAGNVKTIKDALNRTTTNFYDELNRLTRVEDPVNGSTTPIKYEYNAQDRLTKVTDPKNLNTTYTYNGHGDLLTLASPDTGTTTYTHDLAGNALTKLDARGVTVTYTYDALNRVLTVTNPAVGTDPLEVVSYTYDSCTNGKGRLCSVTDKTGTTTFTYNLKGRLASKSQAVGGLTHTINYTYNAAGQLTQVVTPAGNILDYTYQNNRPVSVAVNGQTILSEVIYEPFGPNAGWKWGNHTTGTPNLHFRTVDLDYRTTQVQSDQPQVSSAPVLKSVIGWDYVNRISTITDPNSTASSFTYGYDNLDRVTSATPGTGGTQTFGFSFDGTGNRLTSVVNGSTTNYTYPGSSHRLSSLSGAQSKSYTYDNAGNMLTDGTSTWSYGGNNRPYQVQVGVATIPFAINAFGQRVKKGTGVGATRFFYDEAGHLIGEYADDGALIQETVWLGDLPVAVIKLNTQGDFGGDGKADILWRNVSTGQVYLQPMNGFTPAGGDFVYTESDLNWRVVAQGDFDGDRKQDVLWRNVSTGTVFLQLLDGTTIKSSGVVYTEPDLNWRIVAAKDLDGDGKADIVWWNASTAQVYIIPMNGLSTGTGYFGVTQASTAWKLAATGDFNGDRKQDLLWWNDSTGEVKMQLDPTVAGTSVYTEPNTAWKIVSAPDLNGDGKADIVWRNGSTGGVFGMLMNGTTVVTGSVIYTEPNLAWKLSHTADFNGDGKTDLVWRNQTTGDVFMQLMNGLTVASSQVVYNEPNTQWRIVPAQDPTGEGQLTQGDKPSKVPAQAPGAASIQVNNAVSPNYLAVYYVHTDQLGTPRAITQPSDNQIVWKWDNAEPFGNSQPNQNPSGLGTFEYNLRFPGQYYDKEAGTHYNYFRDYDPITGRYLRSDPAGLIGGLNTFAYVDGNPLLYGDPLGLEKCWKFNPGNSPQCSPTGRKQEITTGWYQRIELFPVPDPMSPSIGIRTMPVPGFMLLYRYKVFEVGYVQEQLLCITFGVLVCEDDCGKQRYYPGEISKGLEWKRVEGSNYDRFSHWSDSNLTVGAPQGPWDLELGGGGNSGRGPYRRAR